jgi:hypothetical protein
VTYDNAASIWGDADEHPAETKFIMEKRDSAKLLVIDSPAAALVRKLPHADARLPGDMLRDVVRVTFPSWTLSSTVVTTPVGILDILNDGVEIGLSIGIGGCPGDTTSEKLNTGEDDVVPQRKLNRYSLLVNVKSIPDCATIDPKLFPDDKTPSRAKHKKNGPE